tara:strand:+ start:296 stop:496 length:201 start_codon:yes stop_codon:yes gene_type:complete
MCWDFIKDLLDTINIYTLLTFSSLDRLKNYNKNNQNKQYCWYFINYPEKFGFFSILIGRKQPNTFA